MKTKPNIELTDKHEYFVDGVRYASVTEVLQEVGAYGRAADYYTEKSRIRGTYVHKIIEYHLSGTLDEDSIDQRLRGYYDAWRRFEEENRFTIERVEEPICNAPLMLAGTPDIIGRSDLPRFPTSIILDIKTGEPPPATKLQLAGYKVILGLAAASYKRTAVQLRKNGTYSFWRYDNDEKDRDTFLSCLAVYRWKESYHLLTKKRRER